MRIVKNLVLFACVSLSLIVGERSRADQIQYLALPQQSLSAFAAAFDVARVKVFVLLVQGFEKGAQFSLTVWSRSSW